MFLELISIYFYFNTFKTLTDFALTGRLLIWFTPIGRGSMLLIAPHWGEDIIHFLPGHFLRQTMKNRILMKQNYGMFFFSTRQTSDLESKHGFPVNIFPASLSPFNCHLYQAVATLANSPPCGWP